MLSTVTPEKPHLGSDPSQKQYLLEFGKVSAPKHVTPGVVTPPQVLRPKTDPPLSSVFGREGERGEEATTPSYSPLRLGSLPLV